MAHTYHQSATVSQTLPRLYVWVDHLHQHLRVKGTTVHGIPILGERVAVHVIGQEGEVPYVDEVLIDMPPLPTLSEEESNYEAIRVILGQTQKQAMLGVTRLLRGYDAPESLFSLLSQRIRAYLEDEGYLFFSPNERRPGDIEMFRELFASRTVEMTIAWNAMRRVWMWSIPAQPGEQHRLVAGKLARFVGGLCFFGWSKARR